jgi:hypothetical protein
MFQVAHLLRDTPWEKNKSIKISLAGFVWIKHLPIKSHVCSLATANLWMTLVGGGATPFGAGAFGITTGDTICA